MAQSAPSSGPAAEVEPGTADGPQQLQGHATLTSSSKSLRGFVAKSFDWLSRLTHENSDARMRGAAYGVPIFVA